MEDFRPISLCNVRYKIISKILVNRLRRLLLNNISELQGAFLPRKRPSENIIVAKEVQHLMRKSSRKKKFCALKLDIQKAYDKISWPFLTACLHRMGFSEQVVHRLPSCVTSVKYCAMINGKSDVIRPSRGLRRGPCPLIYSPYVGKLLPDPSASFLLCAQSCFRPLLPKEIYRIPLLQYADELLCLSKLIAEVQLL